MKLQVSTFVLFTAHHVAAQVFEVKKPGFDRRVGLPITTAQPVSCTQVVESLEAGEPTPPIELDWEIEMATTDAAHCSVTMRSSATAAYASYVSEHAAWWSGLPKRAENIHDLCGKPKMFVDAIPTYFACDGPQTVFVKENPAESTVLSVSERVLDLVMFAEPATTGTPVK
ncbi:hypothetical protein PWT90_06660 [Aphanocladium album]|nr:hypothetical protein PWT90_06660 [Aphanocladium album]